MDVSISISPKLALLEAQNCRYRQLLKLHRHVGSERDLDKLLPLVMMEVSRMLNADRSSLLLFDRKSMALRAKFATGVENSDITVSLKMGIIGSAILTIKTVNIANAYDHPYFNREIDQISGFRTQSILVKPLLTSAGKVIGGLELINKRTGHFTTADEKCVDTAAHALCEQFGTRAIGLDFAKTFVHDLCVQCDCERGSLFVIDEAQGTLVSLYSEGMDDPGIQLSLRLGVAGLVAVTGHEMNIQDASLDHRFDPSFDSKTGYHSRSILCVPILNQIGEARGIVQVINKHKGAFDENDCDALHDLVSVVTIAIENAMLIEEQDNQFHSILAALAASIDAKDPLTSGHSIRVAELAVGIARELDFSESALDLLHVAAILHDYGKIGIDDSVLKKNGKLTPEEYSQMQLHSRMTQDILEKIHFAHKYRNVPCIAAAHHEYLDGSGYPRGLTADEIPFMSKIITVADVFEALTSDRHYRKTKSVDTAFAILDKGAGSKFDANLVAALKRHWESKGGMSQPRARIQDVGNGNSARACL